MIYQWCDVSLARGMLTYWGVIVEDRCPGLGVVSGGRYHLGKVKDMQAPPPPVLKRPWELVHFSLSVNSFRPTMSRAMRARGTNSLHWKMVWQKLSGEMEV